MIKILYFILIFIFFFTLNPFYSSSIKYTLDTGGTILTNIPTCNGNTSSYLIIKPAGVNPNFLMYIYKASYVYEYTPPYRPGQNLLAKLGTYTIPCVVGACPGCAVVGYGFPIIFVGSSI